MRAFVRIREYWLSSCVRDTAFRLEFENN